MSVTDQNAQQAAAIAREFSRSKFIADRTSIPADMLEARFGASFRLNGGEVVAYDAAGNMVFSRKNPGNPAGFDEALEMLIAAHPHRDRILVGGAPAGAGGGGGTGGGGTLTRAAFDALSPVAKHAHVKAGGKVVDA